MIISTPEKMRMPAEWEPHRRLLLEWPKEDEVWEDNLDRVKKAYAAVILSVLEFEPVTLLVSPGETEEARSFCGSKIEIIELPHDDSWARDNCPTFLKGENGRLFAANWQFNGWGEAYSRFSLDNRVPELLCNLWGIPRIDVPIVLEGGSIHSNGRGTILTTAECLLNKNRNPSLSQSEIEETVLSALGGKKMIWLPYGIFNDETSGHIDNICCFLGEDTVLLCWTDDPLDENYDRVRKALPVLSENGLSVEKIKLPPKRMHRGQRLPLSYVNFVFVNGGIVLPGFGDESDKAAKDQLKGLFPDRKVVQLPTMDLIKGGGNIHCITQQIPL